MLRHLCGVQCLRDPTLAALEQPGRLLIKPSLEVPRHVLDKAYASPAALSKPFNPPVSSEAALETIQALLPLLQSEDKPWRARGALGCLYRNRITLMS
eukprot:s724_g5.t1